MNLSDLPELINWQAVLAAPMEPGRLEVMAAIFSGRAEVLSSYVEDDYSGVLAFAYGFPDGSVAIITDYFGSCDGCDQLLGASPQEVPHLIRAMVNNARVFPTLADASQFCKRLREGPQPCPTCKRGGPEATDYPFLAAAHLFTGPAPGLLAISKAQAETYRSKSSTSGSHHAG